jgi:hypothetical protein
MGAQMNDKYLKQWEVPSSSNPKKMYTVSLTKDSEYQCSCPRWCTHVPRQECKHIVSVKNGECDDNSVIRYEMQPGNVGAVTKVSDILFLVPLIPFRDETTDIVATIVYDLLQFGVPWSQIKERYGTTMHKTWSKPAVILHVESCGRCIYTTWEKGSGWVGLQYIPVHGIIK